MTLFAKKLYTGTTVLENQVISIENSKISTIRTGQPEEGHRSFENLAPGLFDIHINGGEKFHFSDRPDEETIQDIYEASVASGTAYVLPTLITSPLDNILKGIEATRSYMEKNPSSGVLGMHLEGPFLNPIKRGAHLTEYLQQPNNRDIEEIIHYGKGVIKLITVAPELFTDEQLKMLIDSGITVSAGHSNATYAQASHAFSKGIHIVTHLYNAMSSFGHREPGLVGATFDHAEVYAPIIIDGVHCDFAAARIAYQQKKDKLFLISDALFLNRKVTRFNWGEFDAYLKDGKYTNSDGNLAGGAISLPEAIQNAVEKVGISIQEAIEMSTIRPAKAVGLSSIIGQVGAGFPAVFTSFDDQLNHFEVIQ